MSDTDIVVMPRRLTAENGAKGLFMGEFSEGFPVDCHCDGEDEDCEFCNGTGSYLIRVPVSWDTVKAIYAMAVDNLGRKIEKPTP